jgi:hypothetical protein
MNTYYSGITLIDGGFADDTIEVDGGTLLYAGSPTVTDKFTAPVWVLNGGAFKLTVAKGQVLGGKLVVVNSTGYIFPDGLKDSVYMQDPSSTVQLSNSEILECDNDYSQKDGTLETTDSSTCTLTDGNTGDGTASIAGGTLWIDTNQDEFGQLKVNGNLGFAGQLGVSIQGYAPNGNAGKSDLLNVDGTLTLSNLSSTLYVNNYGQLQKVGGTTDFWVVIQSSNNIVKDFKPGGETSKPQANLNYGPPNNPVAQQYRIAFAG